MNRSAKIFLRIAAIAVSCMMLMSLFGAVQTKVLADETTYTVRILPGGKGTAETLVYEGMHYGDTITVYVNPALVNDDRYYAKGLKDSGMDNNDPTSDFYYDPSNPYLADNGGGFWTITVTKDQDFVIAYGLASSVVSYTVNYVNAAGTAIAPSQTFYGSIGDMPVISYQYIDGYEPQSNNLTYLAAEGNEFTFTYSVVEQPTQPAEPETTTAAAEQPAQPAEGGGAAEGGAAEGGAAEGGPAEGGAAEGGAAEGGAAEGGAAEGGAAEGGADETELFDVDELLTPTTASSNRIYDGFTITGQEKSGLGDGGDTGEPDENDLYSLPDEETPTTLFKSRYGVYGADGTILFTYNYEPNSNAVEKTAFMGAISKYLK